MSWFTNLFRKKKPTPAPAPVPAPMPAPVKPVKKALMRCHFQVSNPSRLFRVGSNIQVLSNTHGILFRSYRISICFDTQIEQELG